MKNFIFQALAVAIGLSFLSSFALAQLDAKPGAETQGKIDCSIPLDQRQLNVGMAENTLTIDKLKLDEDLLHNDGEKLANTFEICKNIAFDTTIKDGQKRCIAGIKAALPDPNAQAQCFNTMIKKCNGGKKVDASDMCISQDNQPLKNLFGGAGGQNTKTENNLYKQCRWDFPGYLSAKKILDNTKKVSAEGKAGCHYPATTTTVDDGTCQLAGKGNPPANKGASYSASASGATECLSDMENNYNRSLDPGKDRDFVDEHFKFPGPSAEKGQCLTSGSFESYDTDVTLVIGQKPFHETASIPCPSSGSQGASGTTGTGAPTDGTTGQQ